MATKDFRASQIETSKIIGTGSVSAGSTVGIVMYSGSIATNREGGTSDSAMLNNVGTDVFLFVSGTISSNNFDRSNATLFGGDVVVSGTLYAERQVIEVDTVADGDLIVTGSLLVKPDTNSTGSVVFEKANGDVIFTVDSANSRVGVGVSDPDTQVEIFGTGTQLKLSNNADDAATFAVGTNGDLTITTVDAAGGNGDFVVVADGAVDIDANAGALSLDGSAGINIGTETDVAVDINASTLTIDTSSTFSVDGEGTSNITTHGALTVSGSDALNLHSDGGEIDITARQGNIDINAEDGTVTIDAVGTSNFTTHGVLTVSGSDMLRLHADSGSVAVNSRMGSFTVNVGASANIDADESVAIESSGGAISIGADNVNQNINIGTDGTRTIQVGAGDGTTTTTINSRGGTLTLDGTGQTVDINSAALDIDASGAVTIDSSSTISIGPDNVAQNINIGTHDSASRTIDIGSNAATVEITSKGGTLLLDGTGQTVDLNSAALDIDASGAINIDGTSTFSVDAVGTSNVTTHGTLNISGSDALNLLSDGGDVTLETRKGDIVFKVEDNANFEVKVLTGSDQVFSLNRQESLARVNISAKKSGDSLSLAAGSTILRLEPLTDKFVFNSRGEISVRQFGGTAITDVSSYNNSGDTGIVSIFSSSAPASANPPTNNTDINFFASGSIGSRGSAVRGTSLFGGDLVVSGGLGVNSVTVTTDGKVGIGMTNPSYKLSVGGNAEFGEFLYHRGDTDTFIQFADDAIGMTAGNVQLITITEAGQDIVKIGDGTDVDFQVRTNGDDNTLYVQGSSDRVGIGTNSPSSILHVKEAGPTVTIQRESNANSSTLQFMGQAGAIANMVHMATTNDLVFSTHDGVDQEEILRLGSHYGSDLRQVILLSGSQMAASAMHPKESADINFFVSGAIGSRGTATRGTAVFGGDLHISGAVTAESGISGGTLDESYDSGGTGSGAKITVDSQPVQLEVAGSSTLALAVTGSVIIGSSSNGPDPASVMGLDTNFFVSGSIGSSNLGNGAIGSTDGAVAGTSVFSGDVVVSGSFKFGGLNTQHIGANATSTSIGTGGLHINLTHNLEDFRVASNTQDSAFHVDGQPTHGLIIMKSPGTGGTSYQDTTSNTLRPMPSDIGLYVSGAVGAKLGIPSDATIANSTSVFVGDLVLSGGVHVQTGSAGTGLFLTSPDGSSFRLDVANDGTLSASKIT